MLRHLACLMLILTSPACAEPLLSVRGELTAKSPQLKSGEYHQLHKLSIPAGRLVTLSLSSEVFPPYLVATTPDGRRFARGVSGAGRQVQLELLSLVAGVCEIAVTTDQPGQRGTYHLQGQAQPLRGGAAGLKPLLSRQGNLTDTAQDFGQGLRGDVYTLPLQAGQVVRVQVESTAFDALLAVTPPGAEMLKANDVQGKNPELAFLTTQSGPARIVVLPSELKGRGAYRLTVTGAVVATAEAAPAANRPLLADETTLGPGSPKLESGEWGRLYTVKLAAGQTCVLQVEATGFKPRIMALLPDGKTLDHRASGATVQLQLTASRAGLVHFCLASTQAGVGGSFRLSVKPQDPALAAAPVPTVEPAAVPTPAPTTPPAPARDPRVPPPPKFKATALLDLNSPGLTLSAPKPQPATVQNPGILAKTLHQMNYLCVQAGGWSEMNEQNWLYPRANDTTHGSQRLFFIDPDNQFTDAQGNYTVPLQWQGNVFTCRHHRNLDQIGGIEMLDIVGTVSPDGNRVQWVTIREYVQEAYWNEAEGLALLSRRLYQSISLVDLPLRNLYYNPESGAGSPHHSMQDQLKGTPLELVLRNGFHYGYESQPEAGQHVLDLGYLQQDPAVRGARYIDKDQIHTVEYRSTHWGHPSGRSTAKLFFERRTNAR